jgi:hypothetical protein
MKGKNMTAKCVCGFTEDEAGDFTIDDHLFEMFAPEDGRGANGRYHIEGEPDLTCWCGLAAGTAAELDAHFAAVFTPADAIGCDGKKHHRVAVLARDGGR